MPQLVQVCFCCGGRYYAQSDGCPYKNISKHSEEIAARVMHYMINSGWDFQKRIPKDLHKEAIYEVLWNGYQEKAEISTPANVKEFYKILEQT